MEMVEIIRRWQAGESAHGIARASGVGRNSVDKYLRLAKALGIEQDGEPPGEEVVRQLVLAVPARTAARECGRAWTNGAEGKRREQIAGWLREERCS